MRYEAYFHPGQEITLRRHSEDAAGARLEDFHGVLLRRQDERFEVALGTGERESGLDLATGEMLEVLSSRYGLGLRLSTLCRGWKEAGVLELAAQGDLQIFYRRQHLRIDTELWFGVVRQEEGKPPPLRRWQAAMDQRAAGRDPAIDATIFRCRLNLGAGGLRLPLPPPVTHGETCLCLLALDDRQPLIAALAEVIWTQPRKKSGQVTCGLRFCAILAEDQRRIDRYVNSLVRSRQSDGESADPERSFSV